MQISPQKVQDLLRRSRPFALRESHGVRPNSGLERGLLWDWPRKNALRQQTEGKARQVRKLLRESRLSTPAATRSYFLNAVFLIVSAVPSSTATGTAPTSANASL